MNALLSLLLVTGMVYGIFIDGKFWKIYFSLVTVYFIVTHLILRDARVNGKRKTILMSTWSTASDPTSYLHFDWNMTKAMQYIDKVNKEQSEVKVTLTHLFTYAACHGMYKGRRDMGRISWGFFKRSKKYGFTVLVDVDGGKDLIPVTVWDGHNMTLIEIAKMITNKVVNARNKKDKTHEKSTASFNFIPSFIGQPILYCLSYLTTNCGLNIPAIGARADQFGHFVLTNVGSLKIQCGYAPLCTPMHSMGLFCTGIVEKKPAVVDGKIEVADMMQCVMTGDHRFGDATIGLPMIRCLETMWKDPENFKTNIQQIQDKVPYDEVQTEKKSQ